MNTAELDSKVRVLQEHREAWARLPVASKAKIIERVLEGVLAVSERQVAKSVEAKGIPPDSQTAAEEWLGGPVIALRYIRLIHISMKEIAKYGTPRVQPEKVSTRSNGQVVVNVFPASRLDGLVYKARADIWMQPELRLEDLKQNIASFYRHAEPRGKVTLVLGAGNVSSIDPIDIVYYMFVEGAVCMLKPNPINEYLGPFWEEAFAPLIAEGYLRLAYGGGDVGAYLCQHSGIDEIHITGNSRTHDAIVFGVGAEGAERKSSNRPRLNKRMTSELGNVSPIIIVPGQWSENDLQFQAENIATGVTNNAGFNCNANRVLITHADWAERDALLDALRETFRNVPTRRAYYPGASDRQRRIVEAHPKAETLGEVGEGGLPWTMVVGVDSRLQDDICFKEESFCGAVAETSLSAESAADFLRKAVDFCNETLTGTLNAGIIVDPKTAAQLGPSLDQAIADLRYGTVSLNLWPALNFGLGTTTWGAYPGHTLDDIQSGIGVVHNALMFDKPQKTVVYGPFRQSPKPGWFATNRAANKLTPRLARFEAHPSWSSLLPLIWYSLKG